MKRVLSLLLVLMLFFLSSCYEQPKKNILTIDVLNIGKADCIIIRYEDDTIMIDTGEEENLHIISDFLKKEKINSLHSLILTHFDKDHIGGASYFIDNYTIGKIYQSDFSSHTEEFMKYQNSLEETGYTSIRLTESETFLLGPIQITIYPPERDSYERNEDNNASILVTVEYNNCRFLFCGDAMEERVEEYLSYECGNFDWVKLPYHGKYLDNYPVFLASTACQYAVMTCSKKNPPSPETLSRLTENNISYYVSKNGTIHTESDGKTITITQ